MYVAYWIVGAAVQRSMRKVKEQIALDDKVKYANEICFKRTFAHEMSVSSKSKIVYKIHTNAIQMNHFKFSGKHLRVY